MTDEHHPVSITFQSPETAMRAFLTDASVEQITRAVVAALDHRIASTRPDSALHFVFDGPPGPEAGRFVECETPDGRSVNAGEWRERPDGYWEMRVLRQPAPRADDALRSAFVAAIRSISRYGVQLLNGTAEAHLYEIFQAALASEKPPTQREIER